MKNYRIAGVCICLLGIVACFFVTVRYKDMHSDVVHNQYEIPLEPAPKEKDPIKYINEDFSVNENFSSHLPIVVLEMEEEPPITTQMNLEEERHVTIEGVEPYVSGKMLIYESKKRLNSLNSQPVLENDIRIKRRGNSSMTYEKAQYLIKTVTESGQYRDIDILGMGEEHEWVLNGSMADKSMLRNYLAYSLASEVMPYTPDKVFCEVLITRGGKLVYEGVYLLGESIKQGKERINISDYKEGSAFNSYLIRRDRLDDNGIMLDTYAMQNNLSSEYFGIQYPSKKNIKEDMIDYVEGDINRIEKILYSDDIKVFETYPNVIDVDSFVDYFLVNEFLGSYDSGNNSTYYYKEKGGKLTMGPVWDSDQSMDNYKLEPFDVGSLAFQIKPWFEQLCRDNTFITKLEVRYAYLRRSVFSDKNTTGKIDEIIKHLGGAREREWYRWSHIYTEDNRHNLDDYVQEDGSVIIREAKNFNDEIYRIKTVLRLHGREIGGQLELLREKAEFTTGIRYKQGLWLFLAVCTFTVPLYYIARHK